ncbi:MAG: hypothetical protein KME32_36200 [Mojavia pulchra JT2-VF2]|uniref:Uncharacterized protein n=1 Tax=Mojavia pulchra JT2-VF2 TaxID=287848 RepID=A0A951UKU2_9NOST|nr:hypothetical protein [Mojavia pulchra JT2-VF2]
MLPIGCSGWGEGLGLGRSHSFVCWDKGKNTVTAQVGGVPFEWARMYSDFLFVAVPN